MQLFVAVFHFKVARPEHLAICYLANDHVNFHTRPHICSGCFTHSPAISKHSATQQYCLRRVVHESQLIKLCCQANTGSSCIPCTTTNQGRAQELAEGGLRQISNGTPSKNIPRHRAASGFTLPHSLGGSVSSQANQPQ